MAPVQIPKNYDYVAVYLTDRCPLRCAYCITEHNETKFISGKSTLGRLEPEQWAQGLNRLELPEGVPVTLQGGEPFVYPGIWKLLEGIRHPIDILTALPRSAMNLPWEEMSEKLRVALNRAAPYPNVRVSYHPGQNKLADIIPRVLELKKYVSIGIYSVDHPDSAAAIADAREQCAQAGISFKTKEYLGYHEGKLYGEYRYPDAVVGRVTRSLVDCKNSVLILSPKGDAYRCHADLYQKRHELAFGNILDLNFAVPDIYRPCRFYGTCSECDVKVKNNHEQRFGYTSVEIRFPEIAGDLSRGTTFVNANLNA